MPIAAGALDWHDMTHEKVLFHKKIYTSHVRTVLVAMPQRPLCCDLYAPRSALRSAARTAAIAHSNSQITILAQRHCLCQGWKGREASDTRSRRILRLARATIPPPHSHTHSKAARPHSLSCSNVRHSVASHVGDGIAKGRTKPLMLMAQANCIACFSFSCCRW